MKKLHKILVIMIIIIAVTPLLGQQYTIWLSPLTMSTNEPDISINPASPAQSIRVTTAASGDLQWVNLGLPVPSNVQIDSVKLCYELSSSSSFISQIRLTSMTTPDAATVMYDDPTDLTNVGPTCYSSHVDGLVPDGAITLSLRLNYASASDWIDFGAIGLVVSPTTTSLQSKQNPTLPDQSNLQQNYPNPFNPSTTIDYSVQNAGKVRIDIYNSLGQLVRTLVNETKPVGEYSVRWNGETDSGEKIPSGAYFYQLQIGEFRSAKKMLHIK
ncbi:MAG: T9SS type A sorting domain-containing protein [Aliifodinibius sp.]|nr:T9SS type A sorting domain-containing protein [Fodinibius sp.]NIV11820.1 T9SS type A sorting domain-containing protein [Fodinibius sp.]NIY25451.1 T9SS type A sorting domain-containing protein [Fodinibius sp.]